ncbi:MAG: restriction endonuclease subunit S [Oscillatoria sp. PMC 1068.18]|nr:restriction endonuclease subunit S [Oscillatoria sp. PMC 1068.18]
MKQNTSRGWISINFMDVFDIQGGTQPPKKEFIYKEQEGYIRLLQIRDFGDKPVPTYIPKKKTLKICNEDDILIGRYGASVGRICTGMPGAYNVALAKVIVPSQLYKKFVYFLLQSDVFQKAVLSTERSAQNGFNKEDLSEIPVPLPPLNEQKRIVAKLEKLLAKVEACQERLDRIPTILSRFRQSVLAAACSGRLTADWRDTDHSHEYDYPITWKEVILGDIVKNLQQGWSPKCEIHPSPSNEVWGVIKTTAVQSLNFVESENKKLPAHLKPRTDLEIQKGDVLITRAGPRARAGVTCLVSSVRPKLIVCDKVYRFHAKQSDILAEYLVYYLNSPSAISIIDELKTGISDSGVNLTQKKFLALTLCIPPPAEQQEIVKRVETLFQKADRIEQRYHKAKAYVDKLTQSILAKAFRGELVPQDPNDEPASVLLERIRTERAKQETEAKAAKKSKKGSKGGRKKKKPAEPKQLEIPGIDVC